MCIKSMVDELIRKRKGEKIRKPTPRASSSKAAFKPRDKSTEGLFDPSDIQTSDRDAIGGVERAKESVKRITEKLTNVTILPTSVGENRRLDCDTTRTVGDRIGDDDL
uniref:Uncharacterized protein n=1 Tax=Ciona savignyi TaxID=51511 RepID=H2YYP4_CIOSA